MFLACQLRSLETLADATEQTAERQHIVLQVGVQVCVCVCMCVCVCVCVCVFHNKGVKMSHSTPTAVTLLSSHFLTSVPCTTPSN